MGAVITNRETKLKIGHVFADEAIMPRFSILNPKYTLTLPHFQMVSGIYDIFNHICEQYFSGEDDNTSDYISEGLMRSVIHSSRIANKNPQNYEARSNLMWTATWALNTLVAKGKSTDWMVHMLGQAVGAHTDATHGMTLSAVSLPYYRYILPYGLAKFVRFAKNVWDIDVSGKTDEQAAGEGLAAMESWMNELGFVMNISELGADEGMLERLADSTLILDGGYKVPEHDDIVTIFPVWDKSGMNEFRPVIQFLAHCQPETKGIRPGKYEFHSHCGKHIGKEGSRINKVFHERYLI